MCDIAGCVLVHPVLNGSMEMLYKTLINTPPAKREKLVITWLEVRQPPKVSQQQKDRYFARLKKEGVDTDRHPLSKNPAFCKKK
jgi:hypothetical protein